MSEQIVKYKKKKFSLNIGFFVFLMIIVYVIFNIFSYFTSKTVSEYEVVQGSIVSNNIYVGLAIRDESIVYADRAGYLNYYQTGGSKVSVHDLIYSIDSNGIISDAKNTNDTYELTDSDLEEISESLDNFMATYQSTHFYDTSFYKDELSTAVEQAVNNQMLGQISEEIALALSSEDFFAGYSATPGIVMYYIDGMEGISVDSFSPEMLNSTDYDRVHLNTREEIGVNEPIYKLINSESWNIIMEVSDAVITALGEDSTVKIRFCEDDFTLSVPFSVIEIDGKHYLNLSLNKGMIRYANERYIDVELILADESGLKIPNSAITSKEFYTVPREYFMQGGDSSAYGLLVNAKDSETDDFVFIAPTIYYETDEYYYIDSEYVSAGDLIRNSTGEIYVIGTDTDALLGVYNINKGYAVFKQINIIFQNEEYTIVEQRTAYGIALYDHIALDASVLNENELIVD